MTGKQAPCTHHYLIDTPDGQVVVHAVCKKCGDERDYEPGWLDRMAGEYGRQYANRVHHARVRTERSENVKPLMEGDDGEV